MCFNQLNYDDDGDDGVKTSKSSIGYSGCNSKKHKNETLEYMQSKVKQSNVSCVAFNIPFIEMAFIVFFTISQFFFIFQSSPQHIFRFVV